MANLLALAVSAQLIWHSCLSCSLFRALETSGVLSSEVGSQENLHSTTSGIHTHIHTYVYIADRKIFRAIQFSAVLQYTHSHLPIFPYHAEPDPIQEIVNGVLV